MEDCPICLEPLGDNYCLVDICPQCKKGFCKKCLAPDNLPRLENCPHCRVTFCEAYTLHRVQEIIRTDPDYKYIGILYYFLAQLEESDTEEYIKYLKLAAENKVSCAHYELHDYYSDKDSEKAKICFEKACQGECISAIHKQAKVEFLLGNHEKYIELLNKASENNLSEAQYDLAMHFISGDYVEKDLSRAIALFERASGRGNGDASAQLSHLYFYGCDLFEKDIDKAIEYAKMAAEKGVITSQANLGGYYFEQGNYYQSLYWFNELVVSGREEYKLMMAQNYRKMAPLMGNEMLVKAIEIYEDCIDNEDKIAMFELASIYYAGNNVLYKDDKKAFELFKASADAGYGPANLLVSAFYNKGIGTPVNPEMATLYSNLAIGVD